MAVAYPGCIATIPGDVLRALSLLGSTQPIAGATQDFLAAGRRSAAILKLNIGG
jgi:hypothetical protein